MVEFPKISNRQWNSIFWLTLPDWKMSPETWRGQPREVYRNFRKFLPGNSRSIAFCFRKLRLNCSDIGNLTVLVFSGNCGSIVSNFRTIRPCSENSGVLVENSYTAFVILLIKENQIRIWGKTNTGTNYFTTFLSPLREERVVHSTNCPLQSYMYLNNLY